MNYVTSVNSLQWKSTLFLIAMTNMLNAQLNADTFGAGANAFTMEFITIGYPGNSSDIPRPAWGSNGRYGAVPYEYQIGKYEVSRDMVNKANAAGGLGITMYDMSALGGNGANRPATDVSWNEAARFVNWLNTSQGFSPAYKFAVQPGEAGYNPTQNISLWNPGDLGYNAANRYRNSLARYVLPSENEWYKAAYFDGQAGVYYGFATGSDNWPTAVPAGSAPGTAVYGGYPGPADVDNAGGVSPFGTMAQGGNVMETLEDAYDGVNNSASEQRVVRGGSFGVPWEPLSTIASTYRDATSTPDAEGYWRYVGFRVAAVPEPISTSGVLGIVGLSFALWRHRVQRR